MGFGLVWDASDAFHAWDAASDAFNAWNTASDTYSGDAWGGDIDKSAIPRM